jgi:hypothetical protein
VDLGFNLVPYEPGLGGKEDLWKTEYFPYIPSSGVVWHWSFIDLRKVLAETFGLYSKSKPTIQTKNQGQGPAREFLEFSLNFFIIVQEFHPY